MHPRAQSIATPQALRNVQAPAIVKLNHCDGHRRAMQPCWMANAIRSDAQKTHLLSTACARLAHRLTTTYSACKHPVHYL
jgi:hypothetical protein